MNGKKKKIIGIAAVLMMLCVACVGAASADSHTHDSVTFTEIYTVTFDCDKDKGGVSQASISGIQDSTEITEVKNTITINGTTVTATPAIGYHFKEWTGIPDSRTVTRNIIITAVFEPMTPGEVEVSNNNVNFGTKKAGYSSVEPQKITIQNGKTEPVTLEIVDKVSNEFTYTQKLPMTINSGETKDITITPKSGLLDGEHSDSLIIADKDSIYATVFVKFNVVTVPEGKENEVIVPVTPVVDTKDVGINQIIVIDETKNTAIGDEDSLILFSKEGESRDKVTFKVTNTKITTTGSVKTIELTGDSEVSVEYPERYAEYAGDMVVYSVNLNLKDFDTNIPSLSGEYKNNVASRVSAVGYTPLSMVSSLNTDNESIDENIKVTKVAFILSTDQIPSGKKTAVVHVSGAEATRLMTTKDDDKSGNMVVTGTNPNGGFSSYVIAVREDTSGPEPEQTTKSPFPVLGILAGLGIAGVLVMRRK